MSVNGHKIVDVDQSLYDLLSGNTTVAGEAVEVFIEAPSPTAVRDRKFPSLVVMLRDIVLDTRRMEVDEGEWVDSLDDDDSPTESTTYTTGQPYSLVYSVETFARTSASQPGASMDRELLQLVTTLLPPRTALIGVGVDSDDVWVHQLSAVSANEERAEHVVYHRVFTYEVLVVLGSQVSSTGPVATEIQLAFQKATPDSNAQIDTAEAANVTDVTLSVTTDGITSA